ncbi:hypothetical protein [Methylophilus sp. OH31]|uniref:hypothetical protein n=1 Tax=Methylophilus sp. OH31 TaxID=1387312 RepID=UPI00046478C2|nr:hypothetical protein [Methylophilus sp. OH31]
MVNETLTAILVLITGIYSYLTYRMAKMSEASVQEMRQQSEAATRPYVVITHFVRSHTALIYLRISNTGKSAAHNLRLSIDKDFFQFGEEMGNRNLKNATAFNLPLDSFPPSAELIFGLAQGWMLFQGDGKSEKCPTQFTISVQYEYSGKTINEQHYIDLRGYMGSEGERDPLVEELERLRKVIEKNGSK